MTAVSRTRRRVLVGAGTLVSTGLAGCASRGTDGDQSTSQSPTTETPPRSDTPAASTTSEHEPTTSALPGTTSSTGTRDVTFESSTGSALRGTLYGEGTCGVVLVPQVNMDRESWKPQATQLATNDVLAFPIDEGEEKAAGVAGAVRYLRETQRVENVVLVGASTGGEAVLTAAAGLEDGVDGLVTLSAAGGAEHAADLTGQKLFVVSEDDESRFVDTARTLHERAASPKELLVYEGSTHGQPFFSSKHETDLLSHVVPLVEAACT